MAVVIAGGSAAGLFAGLLLARAGRQVLVLERDCLQHAADVESAAAAAFRPTAPQIVQPHIVMARCRQLLIEHLPDVYAGLLAAGVAEAPLRTQTPDSLSDTAARPGDDATGRRSPVDDWLTQIGARTTATWHSTRQMRMRPPECLDNLAEWPVQLLGTLDGMEPVVEQISGHHGSP